MNIQGYPVFFIVLSFNNFQHLMATNFKKSYGTLFLLHLFVFVNLDYKL